MLKDETWVETGRDGKENLEVQVKKNTNQMYDLQVQAYELWLQINRLQVQIYESRVQMS